MTLSYMHIKPELAPPELPTSPFLAVVVSEIAVSEIWLNLISGWIIKSGCRYVVNWGIDCEKWHDWIDESLLEVFEYNGIPQDHDVMTTWHSEQPLSDAFWFAGQCASHPSVELLETIILHITSEAQEFQMLKIYNESQIQAVN